MSTTATPNTWSFEVNPGPYSHPALRHSEIASAPAELGLNDLQSDAVNAALRIMNADPQPSRFLGAAIQLFKTTKAHGRVPDQVWYVEESRKHPGTLSAAR